MTLDALSGYLQHKDSCASHQTFTLAYSDPLTERRKQCDCGYDAAMARLASLTQLEAKAQALVAAVDRLIPVVNGMIGLNFARTGAQYSGPTIGDDLEALRALLPAPPSAPQTPEQGK